MKQRSKKLLGVLLTLALLLRLVPAMALTAAAESADTVGWGGEGKQNVHYSENRVIAGQIDLQGNATVTIDSGVTVTVSGRIFLGAYTLTVTGGGTLNVAVTGTDSKTAIAGTFGSGCALIVDGATVIATGGNGGDSSGGKGGAGGAGLNNGSSATLTVNGGTFTAKGGDDGRGTTGDGSRSRAI